mmetsp:Transcript_17816/g.71464  ORF Transcript_17816/g.71464 Transcript_17816/m.71464 type:complete len:303 (+) Transcript_17816:270-1178(+)
MGGVTSEISTWPAAPDLSAVGAKRRRRCTARRTARTATRTARRATTATSAMVVVPRRLLPFFLLSLLPPSDGGVDGSRGVPKPTSRTGGQRPLATAVKTKPGFWSMMSTQPWLGSPSSQRRTSAVTSMISTTAQPASLTWNEATVDASTPSGWMPSPPNVVHVADAFQSRSMGYARTVPENVSGVVGKTAVRTSSLASWSGAMAGMRAIDARSNLTSPCETPSSDWSTDTSTAPANDRSGSSLRICVSTTSTTRTRSTPGRGVGAGVGSGSVERTTSVGGSRFDSTALKAHASAPSMRKTQP